MLCPHLLLDSNYDLPNLIPMQRTRAWSSMILGKLSWFLQVHTAQWERYATAYSVYWTPVHMCGQKGYIKPFHVYFLHNRKSGGLSLVLCWVHVYTQPHHTQLHAIVGRGSPRATYLVYAVYSIGWINSIVLGSVKCACVVKLCDNMYNQWLWSIIV